MKNLLIDLQFLWFTHRRRVLLVTLPLLLLAGGAMAATRIISASHEARELRCLALNIYHEARGEPEAGRRAVATVTMNRVRSPEYPNTICEVVYQRSWNADQGRYASAFSWTTESVDLQPQNEPWQQAMTIAAASYAGEADPALEGALFYHASYVRPYWAKKRTRIAKIGRHVFYR